MNNYDLILKIINTIISGISVIFIIFGWIIPYRQSQKQQTEHRHYEKSIKSEQYFKDRIDEQISKLYVPLYSLSMENKIQTNILLNKLNRNYIFAKGETINDLNENDKFLWIDFVKNHFLPNLNRMKDILNTNMQLIYESELPSSYKRFMKYTLRLNNDLDIYLNSSNINYGNLFVEDNYPIDFDIYINEILDKLLQEQRKCFNQTQNAQSIIFDININNIDYGETIHSSNNNEINGSNEIPFLLNLRTNEKILISSHQFVIGTSNSCNYILSDRCISRKHLMLIKEEDAWYVIDFDSTNGTYLNNTKLHPEAQVKINNGDVIKIGNTSFIFYTS